MPSSPNPPRHPLARHPVARSWSRRVPGPGARAPRPGRLAIRPRDARLAVSALPPPPPPPPLPAPPGARPRIRWGTGDAIWAFVVGLVVSVVAAAPFIDSSSSVTTPTILIAQPVRAGLRHHRLAGHGGPAQGPGLAAAPTSASRFRPAIARGFGELKWFLIGVGVQLLALIPTALLQELHGGDAKQDVVKHRREGPRARRSRADDRGGGAARPAHRGAALPGRPAALASCGG